MHKAIIFVDAKSDENVEAPLSFLKVGGISLLERQLRQLKDVGVEHVYLMSFSMPEMLHRNLSRFKKAPKKIETIDANFIDTSFWDGLGAALLVEEGRLIDDRIYQAVSALREKNSLALFDKDAVMYGKTNGLELDVNGAPCLFASIACVDEGVLKSASLAEGFNQTPLKTVLDNMLKTSEHETVNIDQIETYISTSCRDVPVLWRPISGKGECKRGTKILMAMAQKGALDWPARWIHPVFENMIVYYSLPTFITPNFITLVASALGFFTSYLFAIGHMGPALAGAMIVGVLFGVDGKLARVKMLSSRAGYLEHILDKFVEYSWYLSMAYYFTDVSGNGGWWAVGGLIVLFSLAQTIQGEFFRRLTGRELDDTGVFERAYRLIGAGRNTKVWMLVPFALTQNWELGFWVLAVYSVMSFFVAQWRFIIRTRDYTMSKSEAIAENINKTRYF